MPAIAAAARRRGARLLTGCAVRGVETEAGRVSGVVTERGAVACQAVVLAGGAWSRRFCGNLGLRLPQLITLSSVQRTAPGPLPGAPSPDGPSFAGDAFAVRGRRDGGYVIANNLLTVADLVPASFRELFAFLPALRAEWGGLRLRLITNNPMKQCPTQTPVSWSMRCQGVVEHV